MQVAAHKITDHFLSYFNPLRGLTMSRAVTLLEEGERGAYCELQWLYRFIEKRDAVLRGTQRQILNSITKLSWDIKVSDDVPEGDQALAENQKKALEAAYKKVKNLQTAIEHLVLAEFRGYSHLEKHYGEGEDAPDNVVKLHPVDQWHLCRDGIYGDWCLNLNANLGVTKGDPVELDHFVYREVKDPINEIALPTFIRKSMSQKDWDRYTEKFGIPFVFWILSEAVAAVIAKDNAKLNVWQGLMNQIGSDGSGIFPGGDLKTLDTSGGGTASPYKEKIDHDNETLVIAATSGKLTMLNDSTGLGSGQSESHRETFDDVAIALAYKISETFQMMFDAPILDLRFEGKPHYAYFELEAQDKEDVTAFVTHAKDLHSIGYKIKREQIEEKTGYEFDEAQEIEEDKSQTPNKENSQEQDDEAGLEKTSPALNRQPSDLTASFRASAKKTLFEAFTDDLKPLEEVINRLESASDEEFEAEARIAAQELKVLPSKLIDQVGGAEALYDVLLSAYADGLETKISES